MPQGRPVVVYIAGSGRSGSTLLERLLGLQKGYVNVGEVIELFRKVTVGGERCGCRKPFADCEFWQEVGQRAFNGWSPRLLSHIAALQRRVGRQRHFPRLLVPATISPACRADLNHLGEVYACLYAAICEVSGQDVVVDASKWPAHGLALSRSGAVDLRVVHLVRDARGVAYSWSKSDVVRPHSASIAPAFMATHQVGRTALRWAAFQMECEALTRAVPWSTRIRYEDLVQSPGEAVERCARDLGLDDAPGPVKGFDIDSVTLPSSHGLAGNPSRFSTGRVELRLDEAWRDSMSVPSRRAVTALTLPVLFGYGYLHRRNGDPR